MDSFFSAHSAGWFHAQDLSNRKFVCGFCNATVSSVKGYKLGHGPSGDGDLIGAVYICSNCGGPSFFAPDGTTYPTPALGNPVEHVPQDLNALYEEARRCSSHNCFTATVLLCRKMLMNIAVQQGAAEGLHFVQYVTFLADKGFVPPHGKQWVDHIRSKGNEATHEIALMDEQDARDLITFIAMLLRFIYEFPSMLPAQP
jgi:hypothetical protein